MFDGEHHDDDQIGGDHQRQALEGGRQGRERDESGGASLRAVEPLCLAFWGNSWTLGAWCRLRADFRNFRPDRIVAATRSGERFSDRPERGFDAYLRSVGAGPVQDLG